VTDACEGRQWERKDTAGGLHDVTNRYSFAGRCSVGNDYCQPNAVAEAACMQAGGVGCAQCTAGICDVYPGTITTIWDWLVQINASTFAGRSDWRIPHPFPSSIADEFSSILDCSFSSCLDPVFGPTASDDYWDTAGNVVAFNSGGIGTPPDLRFPAYVRAVRSLP
jgi:hypothetical protein